MRNTKKLFRPMINWPRKIDKIGRLWSRLIIKSRLLNIAFLFNDYSISLVIVVVKDGLDPFECLRVLLNLNTQFQLFKLSRFRFGARIRHKIR